MSHPVLEVVDAGLLLTIQDAGRPGRARDGVTPGGAADAWSMRVANALLGNDEGAAVLEATLLGARLRALVATRTALAGTMTATVAPTGARIAPGTAVTLRGGEELVLEPATGARGYLAVAGGFDVPVVLGSRATALGAAFGGLDGRPLRAGDRLAANRTDDDAAAAPLRWSAEASPRPVTPADPLRVLPGPHAADLGPASLDALVATTWSVLPASDRVGTRLDGDPLPASPTGALASHGVVAGAVQVPPDRRPIVLGTDHQPTGGYPVLAVVITADLPRLGQLAPGAEVAFAATTPGLARAALLEQDAAFARAVRTVTAIEAARRPAPEG